MAGTVNLAVLRAAIATRYLRPVAWGESDCVSAAALALTDMGLPDYRPAQWGSEAEAQALLRARGGLVEAIGRALEADGWRAYAGGPQALDVGVVTRGGIQSLALHDGAAWAAKGPRGVLYASDALCAWRRG